jgi:predicted Zn-dependent protease
MKRMMMAAAFTVTLGACGVSTQQEVQMGQQYSQQINAQLPIVRDPEINRYINVLGDSIARGADNRNLEWHFYVVDSKEVNAFAVPGGFIYINRGLIERATSMDQVAGVLGHEIGHVTQRHSVEQMEKAQKANIGVTLACVLTRVCESQAAGAAINVAGTAVFARFSRNDEAEADRVGVQYVTRAGIDPRGIPEMFRILMQERQARPAGVEAWFLTHPLEEDRINATSAQINQIDPAILRGLTKNSQNFRQFQARVAALPPSPEPRRQGE